MAGSRPDRSGAVGSASAGAGVRSGGRPGTARAARISAAATSFAGKSDLRLEHRGEIQPSFGRSGGLARGRGAWAEAGARLGMAGGRPTSGVMAGSSAKGIFMPHISKGRARRIEWGSVTAVAGMSLRRARPGRAAPADLAAPLVGRVPLRQGVEGLDPVAFVQPFLLSVHRALPRGSRRAALLGDGFVEPAQEGLVVGPLVAAQPVLGRLAETRTSYSSRYCSSSSRVFSTSCSLASNWPSCAQRRPCGGATGPAATAGEKPSSFCSRRLLRAGI
jgi:hypothetical protein